MPRRTQLLALSLIILALYYYTSFRSSPKPSPIRSEYNIAITELGGSHDEVVASLVHSFVSASPLATVSIFQLLPRYGILELMQAFKLPVTLPKSLPPSRFMDDKWEKKHEKIDILVAGTCEIDVEKHSAKLKRLFEEEETHLFCVVHHAERWGGEGAKSIYEDTLGPWVEKQRVTFLALSPHTEEFLRSHSLSRWQVADTVDPDVKHLVPVFPVAIEHKVESKDDISFSIQGDYDTARRDYKNIFNRLSALLASMRSSSAGPGNITLRLLGHGSKPKVPKELEANVVFHERLTYVDYYSVLSGSFAVVPAFATKEYFDRKASSSVPAALIAGVPIIADTDMMRSYRYLNKNAVWEQKKNEIDMDVVRRLAVKSSRADREKKKANVRKLRDRIIEANEKMVRGWVARALAAAEHRDKVRESH